MLSHVVILALCLVSLVSAHVRAPSHRRRRLVTKRDCAADESFFTLWECTDVAETALDMVVAATEANFERSVVDIETVQMERLQKAQDTFDTETSEANLLQKCQEKTTDADRCRADVVATQQQQLHKRRKKANQAAKSSRRAAKDAGLAFRKNARLARRAGVRAECGGCFQSGEAEFTLQQCTGSINAVTENIFAIFRGAVAGGDEDTETQIQNVKKNATTSCERLSTASREP